MIYVKKDKSNRREHKNIPLNNEEKIAEELVQTSMVNQQNPLLKSEECLYHGDCSGFYPLLNTELKHYLSNKFSISPAEVNTKNIAIAMDKLNISNNSVLQLQQLLQEIEWQLYTPFERNERMKELYEHAHDIISLINSETVRHL